MPNGTLTASGRLRSVPVTFKLASHRDSAGMIRLWRAHGEGNVDVRERRAINSAIEDCNFYVIRAYGDIIGTAARYRYPTAPFVEFGSSCLMPCFRGSGIADISLNLRVVLSCLNDPGAAIVTELYPESSKSAKVVRRWHFEEVPVIPVEMHEHAHQANAERPVRHFVCPPVALPPHAQNLLRFLKGARLDQAGGDVAFAPKFARSFRLDDPAILCAVERLADGEVGIAGWKSTSVKTDEWLASLSDHPLMSYDQFLSAR